MSGVAGAAIEDAAYTERWRVWQSAYADSNRKTVQRVTVVFTVGFAAVVVTLVMMLVR